MNARLDGALASQEANYLLPFLWQRGEDEATICEEMKRVDESGISSNGRLFPVSRWAQ